MSVKSLFGAFIAFGVYELGRVLMSTNYPAVQDAVEQNSLYHQLDAVDPKP